MKLDIKLDRPLADILPKEWRAVLPSNLDNAEFRNLRHFKNFVSTVTQKKDNMCDVSYAEALRDLLSEKPLFSADKVEHIRNLVRANLLKRGLITKEIYDRYKYNVDGLIVDIGELNTGNPECVLTPAHSYVNHFHELYINISYPYYVTNETVVENAIKLLATIEELERLHIFIKVSLVLVSQDLDTRNGKSLITTIPLFSHKDYKSVETMGAVVNDRLLRKFCFALFEDIYGSDLVSGYGKALNLPKTINIGETLDEIDLFTEIQKGKR